MIRVVHLEYDEAQERSVLVITLFLNPDPIAQPRP